MNINSLSTFLPSYLTTGGTSGASSTSTSSSTNQVLQSLLQASSSSISPTASFLSQLQQLQQQDPSEYSQVASSIATQLQADAKTAQSDGNATQATALNQLATVFQNSSQTGQLPSAQALQQAGLSGHHHHHGGGHHADAADSSTQTTSSSSTSGNSIESLLATAFSNALASQGS